MTLQGQNLSVSQVLSRIQMVQKMQKLNDPKFREYHETIYNDGVWKIDMEMFAISGVIRFWVSREDAYGNYQNSLFIMYVKDDGTVRYSADYQIKKSIVEKMKRICLALHKAGIKDC